MAATSVQTAKSDVELRVNEALEYIEENPGAKIRSVAKKFNVPRSRLQRRANGVPARKGHPARNTMLSREEEVALCNYIDRLDKANFAVRPEFITDAAHLVVTKRRIADGWGGTRKIKTIHHASVLYERATEDRTRYQGRTRADFDTLHQSVHEFRVVDRSDAHTREIRGAERPSAQATWPVQGHEHEHEHEHELDTNTLLNQLFAEVSNNLDEQGAWSQWWPAIDQVDL
ncbi:Homeodomain-like protein [Metarhizium album ARSEF 1941]|uniref:Homeodomain-like protein n=1 Tax=Metarhizium album (strain ARSEF 1941) TaxID=1081103 RepID=A0A0B2WJG4_METAS|nr:Homeodomain-like protein [Metarhizium album ARSEF 1941]KHN94068.1 Homeodomain-like protein [Metarhizium album ARSEF 1941]